MSALIHYSYNLIWKYCIMSTAKTYNLHIFKLWCLSCYHRRWQHSCMEIIGYLCPCIRKHLLIKLVKTINRNNSNSFLCKHFRYILAYKWVCMIWSSCKHNSKCIILLSIINSHIAKSYKFTLKSISCICCLSISFLCLTLWYWKFIDSIFYYLVSSVFLWEPVEYRCIKLNPVLFLWVLWVSYNHRISHNNRTHIRTQLISSFWWHMHNIWHKYSINILAGKILYMSVDKLCRKTYCIWSYIFKPFLIHFPVAFMRKLDIITQCLKKCCPERHTVKEFKHSWYSDCYILVLWNFFVIIRLK